MIGFKARLRRFVFDLSAWVIVGSAVAVGGAVVGLILWSIFSLVPELGIFFAWFLFWGLLAAVTYRRRSL